MPAPGRRETGVTLMELMIVVVIVGILAAIAYPSYTQFVMQTNRTDATKTMQLAAQSLERCYSVNFTYLTCTIPNASANPVATGSTLTTPNKYYTITFNFADAQDYQLVATQLSAPQTADAQCTTFTLRSSGQQQAADGSGNDTTRACWGSN